nr:TSC22 domain family protein 4 isoform X2 [Macaca fascicularis]
MSGGKKKSSFQITSVTTDYEGPGSPGTSDPPTPQPPTGPLPRLPSGEPSPDPGGKGTPRNGSPPPGAPSSRFRVVKLPHGLGEPYRRGRWTCVDVYERDLEPHSFGRLLEGIRGASGGAGGRSLDSRLELASLGLGTPTPQSGLSQGPTSWLRPPPTSPGPQARSFTGGLGQLVVPGKAKAETPPLSASPPQQRPPEPGTGESAGTSRAATPLPSLRVDAEAGGSGTRTPPLSRRKAVDMRLRMELGAPEEMGQVFFWRQKIKPTISEHPGSKKHSLKKMEKTLQVAETLRLVESPKEAKPKLAESPKLADPCVLAKTTEGTKVELGRQGRSLLQLPRTAVKSVSTLMVSALQSGWQMCSWKSSVSSASVSSQVRTQSPLKTPEAEMLWEVYLVLWAVRKQLRQLSRRQERHRRHHVRCHAAPRPNPAQSLKLDAQSPL